MKASEITERLSKLNPETEISIKTDGIAGPFVEYEIKAFAELTGDEPKVEIVLKRVV